MNQKSQSNNDHNLFKIKSPAELKKVLKTGIDINTLNSSNQNALFGCRYPELVKAMISSGININQTDILNKNALFYTPSPETLGVLAEHGIDINHTDTLGRNALFYSCETKSAGLLIKNGININHTDLEDKNALFFAVSESLVSELIDSGIDINHTDSMGRNALFYACDLDIRRLLIQRGINVNRRDIYNNNAVRITSIDAELLNDYFAAGLDPNIQDYYGNSLIFYPYKKSITDVLINNNCDINHVNNNGETVFEYIQTMLFSNRQLDQCLSVLTPYIHFINARPLIFNRLTFGCLELIKILQSQNIDYKINERCVVRYANKDIKKFITEVQKVINISHITFCSWYDTPLVSLKNKEIIKWFIRNNIKVNVNDIEEPEVRIEILAYLASRENKELKTLIKPVIKDINCKRRL
ncbi:ankyrin repeat domain-containing protein [Klebsiella aerogenes]|uniref:ankyrin repeat domain-containing protein n=1 Tax=Klebsiella aerogenes TaxID=548 RepID=UPI001C22D2C0|nr:ankyrin repeat domain-containing protein [Klebsiella aerogenes]QXA74140.1 ankyrin repeat domain-containing protein [Klebsiella aerogenes]